jgi:hypothetical protein
VQKFRQRCVIFSNKNAHRLTLGLRFGRGYTQFPHRHETCQQTLRPSCHIDNRSKSRVVVHFSIVLLRAVSPVNSRRDQFPGSRSNTYHQRSFRLEQARRICFSGLRSGGISLRSIAQANFPRSLDTSSRKPLWQHLLQHTAPTAIPTEASRRPFPSFAPANESACAVEESLFDRSRKPETLNPARIF